MATSSTSPQFRFFVCNGSTRCTLALPTRRSSDLTWNTAGLAAASYTIEAWVRADTSGTYQAVSPDVPYTLGSGGGGGGATPCTAVAISPKIASAHPRTTITQ